MDELLQKINFFIHRDVHLHLIRRRRRRRRGHYNSSSFVTAHFPSLQVGKMVVGFIYFFNQKRKELKDKR